MKTFSLDNAILRLDTHLFTIRQACEGVQILGGIGSGKTSGSGAALARGYLTAGFGGLVLCAKKDELATWQQYARETGREDSLLVFDTSGDWVFPFLQYEIEREGEGAGYTENIVRLFISVHEAISRSKQGGGDPFWTSAMQQLIRNAVDLAMIATGSVSVPLLYDIVRTAPQNEEEKSNQEWQNKSTCCQLLVQGNTRDLDKWVVDQSPEVLEVIEKEKPNLAKAIEAMRARQKKPGESPEINHGVKAAIMILVMIGAMGACRQETTKTKEAYEKAIVGRWRVDANFVETGLSEYMKRFDSIAETNPNKEAIPMIKELLRESQKEWVADLNDYWMEFQADGTTRFVQSEDKKEQAGKYTFSPGLDSLYILNENGKKRNLFGIERLSKDELILRWPMGVTATDSVEYLQYKMIRND